VKAGRSPKFDSFYISFANQNQEKRKRLKKTKPMRGEEIEKPPNKVDFTFETQSPEMESTTERGEVLRHTEQGRLNRVWDSLALIVRGRWGRIRK